MKAESFRSVSPDDIPRERRITFIRWRAPRNTLNARRLGIFHVSLKVVSHSGSRGRELREDQACSTGDHKVPGSPSRQGL